MQRQISDVWHATTETDTCLSRDAGLVAECEVIAISTAFALTAARVIDEEVFHKEHGESYIGAKKNDRSGQIVDGLVLTSIHRLNGLYVGVGAAVG